MFSSNTSQVSNDAVFVEDVFSTWLYTGTDAAQTINNGIDLSGKGGMVWVKDRTNAYSHQVYDTARGNSFCLFPNLTGASVSQAGYQYPQPSSTGFSITSGTSNAGVNASGDAFVSWTFRKQPKFFDVVTWTGNSVSGRTVAHSLGSAPGCVIIKSTSDAFDWYVYHQSLGAGNFLNLNLTDAATASEAMFGPGNPAPSSTVITLGNSNATNGNGKTYVAYLFAHNAGGFGLTGTDNVISCGSFTTDGSGNATVNLGYEPQWVLVKSTTISGSNWILWDNMRGFGVTQNSQLYPNLSDAEVSSSAVRTVTATGLQFTNFYGGDPNSTFIYIAIRRGPMKTPTSGTSVFSPTASTGTGVARTLTSGFATDLVIPANRTPSAYFLAMDKLRGLNKYVLTSSTNPESTAPSTAMTGFLNTGIGVGTDTSNFGLNASGSSNILYQFGRAPGFFDEVCWTSTGSTVTSAHNLTVAPTLVITKCRSTAAYSWAVNFNFSSTNCNEGYLNLTDAAGNYAYSAGTVVASNPTASQIQFSEPNSGRTFVSYLFASCPGVSKVGSYTGTGATQTISCGFAARFVLIKRTDSTGDWFVWDTARGMVAGTDPRLALNSTAAESNANWVYTNASGFQIVTTDATVNASGGTYIYLAIA